MKKQEKNKFLYLLFIAALLLFILYVIITIKNNRIPPQKYLPFAYLPEINISQSPNFLNDTIIRESIGLSPHVIDQEMIHGMYQRFPLNQKMQKTSIVAVNAGLEYQDLLAWQVQSSVDTWNYVWAAPNQYYWVTMFDVNASPVVVIKGKFPKCRYFSFMTYTGIESGDDGFQYYGQGISQNAKNVCDATIPGDCQILSDVQIDPDEGSKNPFRDATFQEGDDNFYTVYFVSPYYKGKLPQSKNILTMTLYGLNQSFIMYRIYAPFNPKSCDSPIYTSQLPFSTQECQNSRYRISLQDVDGGANYPQHDKSSPCQTKDSVCIEQCINHEIGKSCPEDCFQYIGTNNYCVCEPQNFYGECGQYLEKTVRQCTNGKMGLSHYCAQAPDQKVDYCINKIPLNEVYENGLPQCPEKTPDYTCEWVKSGLVTPCVYEKIFDSKDKDCEQFKDPSHFLDLCHSGGTCAQKMPTIYAECMNLKKPDGSLDTDAGQKEFDKACQRAQDMSPKFAYHPAYNFDTSPKLCLSKCHRFSCVNGYCVPNIKGEFKNNTCDNQCVRHSLLKESYTSDTTNGCVNRFLPQDCDSQDQPYININNYGSNTFNHKLFTSSGWVGLPDVFLKYSYNDYFVRLQNPDGIRIPQNLLDLFRRVTMTMSFSDPNPLDPFQVKQQNPTVDINDYVQTLSDERQQLVEGYKEMNLIPICKPSPTPQPSCSDYVDPNTYFQNGAEYPKRSLTGQTVTVKVDPLGCSYYEDLCACEHNGNKYAKPCNTTTNGFVGCDGKRCFERWALEDSCHRFLGQAMPFSISADYGKTIVFPNPDDAYIAMPTVYDKHSVYIIWMDCPSTPITPGYAGILNDKYDMRYWSLSHSYWASEPLHQRPGLSGKDDQEFHKTEVCYIDDKYKNSVTGQRVCVLLASFEQYNYLKTYNLLDDRVTWLNWGTTRLPSVGGRQLPTLPPLFQKNMSPESVEQLRQYMLQEVNTGLEEWGIDLRAESILDQDLDQHTGTAVKLPKLHLLTPKRGIVILRQLKASDTFRQSISNYVKSKPECLFPTVSVEPDADFLKPIIPPKMTNTSCNPGNPDICEKYGFDPCCLSKDVLEFTRQYYPRCEKVKICDIENIGALYWKRYFDLPLPYHTDGTRLPQCANKFL